MLKQNQLLSNDENVLWGLIVLAFIISLKIKTNNMTLTGSINSQNKKAIEEGPNKRL